MANKIQIRRDTTANWTASDPILSQGELGLDTTLNKIKIGDGTSNWSDLSFYFGDPTSLINGSHTVALNSTGGVNFPTLSVDIHNGGVQSAQVLKFDKASQQVIITGPTPAAGNSAERIIIQGQRATDNGEGGDVYLWGGDSAINGGDIKIYAGDADSDVIGAVGGYVNIDAGNGFSSGGHLTLSAGVASAIENGYGGNVSITAGYAHNGTPGNIQLSTYAQSNNSVLSWTFTNDGKLTLPAGGDVVNSDGNSVLGGTDIYKFAYGTIGTKANPDTSNGWGGYNMYLDPGGESWASIFIPSNANQESGNALQITNKGAATSIVQVTGWGGVQLVTNTGLAEKVFEFGDDGRLTLPADSLIVSETASTISVGAGLAELETTYTDLMLMLDDIFTQISSESGYPWGITLPLSVPLTYNQLINLSPNTFTGQANATTVAHNANTAYNVWQDAAATTNIHVNVSNKSWMFGNDGKLTLPSGNAQIVAESNGGVRIGTANTNVAPNAQIRIGGADHVFEIFGGPPSYSWKFEADGKLKLPGTSYASTSQNYIHAEYGIGLHPTHNTGGTGPELYISYNDGILIQPFTNDYFRAGGTTASPLFITGSDLPNGNDSIGKLPGDVYIESGTNYQDSTYGKVVVKSGTNQWTFGTNGRTTFPNGTVPAHSYGAAGDKEGMVVFSDNYIYYCKQDYVGNSVNVTTLASSGSFVYVSSTDYAGDLVADFTANSTGWTYAGVSIIGVAVDNTFGPGYALEAATSFGAVNEHDYALVSPVTTDIWKRVSWSVDTW